MGLIGGADILVKDESLFTDGKPDPLGESMLQDKASQAKLAQLTTQSTDSTYFFHSTYSL